jgi:hypothetical protein
MAAETPASKPANPTLIVAVIAGISVIALNAIFLLLSWRYFIGKRADVMAAPISDAHIMGVRIAFAAFTATIGVGVVAATLSPRWVGHGIASAMALGSIIAGIAALGTSIPTVLGVTLILLGVLVPLMVWRSLIYSRAAWSFLLSTCAVLGLILMFGAPKIRGLLGIGLWTAMIIPGLLVLGAVALGLARRDYRETM